jgi:hypothetical protein
VLDPVDGGDGPGPDASCSRSRAAPTTNGSNTSSMALPRLTQGREQGKTPSACPLARPHGPDAARPRAARRRRARPPPRQLQRSRRATAWLPSCAATSATRPLRRNAAAGIGLVALVALTTLLVAMSIDTMLPALGDIASKLALRDPNDRQLVLTTFCGGLSLGQLVWGPVSPPEARTPAQNQVAHLKVGTALAQERRCPLSPKPFTQLPGAARTTSRPPAGFGVARRFTPEPADARRNPEPHRRSHPHRRCHDRRRLGHPHREQA